MNPGKSANVWRPAAHPTFAGAILLDTHIMLWQADDPSGMMPGAAVDLIDRCNRGDGVFVSDISVWEVGNKTAKRQLALPLPFSAWVTAMEQTPSFTFLPVDRGVLAESTALTDAHGDPADRILIATAIQYDMPLVTADTRIIEYARTHHRLTVIDARF